MELESTKAFFEKVRKGNIYEIDKINHVEKITCDYEYEKLKALFMDLAKYIGDIALKKEIGIFVNPVKLGWLEWKMHKLKTEKKEIPTQTILIADPPEGMPGEIEQNNIQALFSDREMDRLFAFQEELDEILEKQLAELDQEDEQEEKLEIGLQHFFHDVKASVIVDIKNEFADFKGKKIAIIIYLLDKKFDKITYSPNSRTDSRKKFVALLTNNPKIRMSGINKYFDMKRDLTFDINMDSDFQNLEERLLKMIR